MYNLFEDFTYLMIPSFPGFVNENLVKVLGDGMSGKQLYLDNMRLLKYEQRNKKIRSEGKIETRKKRLVSCIPK